MIKMNFGKLMNWKPAQKAFSWGLTHASFALPVKPLHQTEHWMAFNHPNPSYPVHILLVPRQNLTDWMDIDPEQVDMESTQEFFVLTQTLVCEFKLDGSGYRLILNGGSYQTFPHLHFHLVSGDAYTS